MALREGLERVTHFRSHQARYSHQGRNRSCIAGFLAFLVDATDHVAAVDEAQGAWTT